LLRLYFAFQTNEFDYNSYFTIRQVEHIKETGFPLFEDDLSYGGRTFVFIPTFHYILAFFSLFMPVFITAKILPNLFASSMVFITYLISEKLTKNTNLSLFISFISAFVPIFFSQTINSISVYSVTSPLVFLAIYFFISLKEKKHVNYFILTIFLFALVHSSVFLLIFGLLFYTAFIKISKLKQDQAEIEVILFSTFLVILLQFLIFKNAFILHGISIIWQNIPPALLFQYFKRIDIIEAILKIGMFPLIFGSYIIYRYTFREKDRTICILTGFAASTFILLWLRLVQADICLAILGITLTLLFGSYYKSLLAYLRKTRLYYLSPFISVLLFLLLIISIAPFFDFSVKAIKNSPSRDEIDALIWLNDYSTKGEVVLATLTEGHLVTAVAERKNLIDSNFLFIEEPSKILDDVNTMFTSPYKIDAIKLLEQYDVDYIFFSPIAQINYNLREMPYIDEECFELIYNKSVKIYENFCSIEVEEYES
jgi:hypothetical protein